MKSYNLFERTIAKALDRFPQLKQVTKTTYQHLNYWYYGDRHFQLALHPQVNIYTPFQWSKTESESGELFFGYYDKTPWSSDVSRFVCHRLKDNTKVEIVVFDRNEQKATLVGTSATWSSQQGSMVQWLGNKQIIFNDLVENKLAAKIVSLTDKVEKVIDFPIQTLNPNEKEALSLNYKRLDRLHPEYGYAVAASNFSSDRSLSEDGIWKVDLESGTGELIISLETLIAYQPRPEMANTEHKVNHIMYSPQGTRFVFMHRWLGSEGKFSRLYVADADGSNLQLLLDDRMVSHYSWRDEENLLAWARTKEAGDRYYLINIVTGNKKVVGEGILDVYGDGHPSFSPNKRWILTDTYPDKSRKQHLLLYEVATEKLIELGSFFAPLKFSNASRCDLHPRWRPDNNAISIDSTYEGQRMTYILDVSAIVNS
ncbi:MAG: hypothetical protein QNJ41_10265 [Xenococcaceae cyanobacterium MO_188.B32]|nr:hypothetical protein [Xenococcaceae cyanobacterium MO_188.B32]